MRNIHVNMALFSACFLLFHSSCTLSQYTKQDRFISKVIKAPAMTTDAQKEIIIGQPTSATSLKLQPKSELILQFPLNNKGYCQSLTVHLNKTKQNEGTYAIWLSHSPFEAWHGVGSSSKTHTFDIDGLPTKKALYVRLRIIKRAGDPIWLKAIQLHTHRAKWLPISLRPLEKRTAAQQKKALSRAKEEIQKGNQLFSKKRYKDALTAYLDALPYFKKDPALLYAIASSYFEWHHHFQSALYYQRASQQKAPTPTQREEMGENLIALREYQKAMQHFHKCVQKAPFYPRCYYHRIRVATLLGRNKGHLYEMYRDQYLLVKQRADIRWRKWSLRKSFLKAYGRTRTPYISKFPEKFTSTQHLRWFGFLLLLYPNDKYGVFREGEYTLTTLRKKDPASAWQTSLYLAVFAEQAGLTVRSQKLLKKLSLKTPNQIALFHAVKGDLVRLQGKEKKALLIYQKGLALVRSGEPRAMLQVRIDAIKKKKQKD